MIRVAFFDVGETLIHDGEPFPGAVDALKIIAQLKTARGQPLWTGIISNYLSPAPPVTEEKIRALEEKYRAEVLEPAGLAELFEPFDSKVTLSSRAGVAKPDRGIFETAITRSQTMAAFDECLFVTEEPSHLEKVQAYGILPIGFRTSIRGIQSFSEWSEAPLLVANVIDPGNVENMALSAAPALDAHFGLCEFKPTKIAGHVVHGHANQLMQLNDPRLGSLADVYVERPTDITLQLTPSGQLGKVDVAKPNAEEVADAANFVHSLVQGGRIALGGMSKGTTHAVQTDARGRKRLVRKRFSFF